METIIPSNLKAFGDNPVKGLLRVKPEDFLVEELFDFDLSDDGQHLWIKVEKIGQNTQWVAKLIAIHYKVAIRNINWSGIKDRYAKTIQWYSIPWPIKKPLPEPPNLEGVKILDLRRHKKGLRIGVHKKNRFNLTIRELSGDTDMLERKLMLIQHLGVPNYFGEQRFGNNFGNIEECNLWFQGRHKPRPDLKSLLLSSARSFLFNEHLSQRIENHTWQTIGERELCMLSGSNSWFKASDEEPASLNARLESGDVSTSGPMWGTGLIQEEERYLKDKYRQFTLGLEKNGLKQQRRPLILKPENMAWDIQSGELNISFDLISGAFATSVLSELVDYTDVHRDTQEEAPSPFKD
jgi:tRNA pseudouridine13 synthase